MAALNGHETVFGVSPTMIVASHAKKVLSALFSHAGLAAIGDVFVTSMMLRRVDSNRLLTFLAVKFDALSTRPLGRVEQSARMALCVAFHALPGRQHPLPRQPAASWSIH